LLHIGQEIPIKNASEENVQKIILKHLKISENGQIFQKKIFQKKCFRRNQKASGESNSRQLARLGQQESCLPMAGGILACHILGLIITSHHTNACNARKDP
jgi:hypothetical protein